MRSHNLRRLAPKMTGSERRKLKRAASSISTPKKRAHTIVAPERETPGRIAKACAKPMSRLYQSLICPRPSESQAVLRRRRPVPISAPPTNRIEEKAASS